MAIDVTKTNRKILQNLRTPKPAKEIRPILSGTTAMGELAVQLGDEKETSLWTLANDQETAVRFVSEEKVKEMISEGAVAEVDVIEKSVGLQDDGSIISGDTSIWGTETNYFNSATTVVDAVKALDTQLDTLSGYVGDLGFELAKDDNKVVVSLKQVDGKVSGSSENITSVKLDGYTVGGDDSGKVAATDTLGAALGKLQGQINGMDKAASALVGHVVTTVVEEDGKVSEQKQLIKNVVLSGYTKSNSTGDIDTDDTIQEALSKLENKAAAITIKNDDGSINVTANASGTDINVNIKSDEKVIKKDGNGGLYTDLDLVKITTGLPAEIKERYQLLASDDSQIGVNIDVPKDSHIVSINYITDSADTHYQNLEYKYIDVNGVEQTTYVDMGALVLEQEFADGLVVADHVVKVKVDPTSEEFLSVGENGVKLSGIEVALASATTEINTTVGGDATNTHMAISASTADDGHTVYQFGLYDVASKSELDALSGTVLDLDATVSAETPHIDVTVVETDGKLTSLVLNETDIASASALTAEIARAKSAETAIDGAVGLTKAADGEGRTWDADGNYLTGTTVKADLEAIDDVIGVHDDNNDKYDVTFTSANTIADRISNILKQIDDNKEALTLTVTDDDKYINATLTSGDTGTTVDVDAIVKELSVVNVDAAATSATTGLVDVQDAKRYFVTDRKANDGANNGGDTKIGIVAASGTTGKQLDFTNLCVDCGTF